MQIQGIPSEYDGTIGAVARLMNTDVIKAGDPKRAGEIFVPGRLARGRTCTIGRTR
jgi:hypothetical protein